MEQNINTENNIDLRENKKCDRKTIHYFIIFLVIIYTLGVTYLLITLFLGVRSINLDLENKKLENIQLLEQIEKIKQERVERINSLDLKTDSSITKFVSSLVSFNDKAYIPQNLVSFDDTYIVDAKGYGELRDIAMTALVKLNNAFYNEFNKNLVVVSSYRSYAYQKGIKDRGCPDNLCAKAGYSEHQSGLAVDLWETTTNEQFLAKENLKEYFEWLKENAHKYGWHNSYQKGLEIDTYEIEPWHWRFVGVELATYLKENNITISEFYNNK